MIRKLKRLLARIGTLNIVLILVGAFFLWFNCQMISLYREVGTIPESYAISVVTATIGECGICGWIRTTKERMRDREAMKEEKEDLHE